MRRQEADKLGSSNACIGNCAIFVYLFFMICFDKELFKHVFAVINLRVHHLSEPSWIFSKIAMPKCKTIWLISETKSSKYYKNSCLVIYIF